MGTTYKKNPLGNFCVMKLPFEALENWVSQARNDLVIFVASKKMMKSVDLICVLTWCARKLFTTLFLTCGNLQFFCVTGHFKQNNVHCRKFYMKIRLKEEWARV